MIKFTIPGLASSRVTAIRPEGKAYHVLRSLRQTGGLAMAASDEAIRTVIQAQWQERRFAWSPEGAATLAAIPELVDRGFIRSGNHVVLVNTASAEKYLPALRTSLDGGLWCQRRWFPGLSLCKRAAQFPDDPPGGYLSGSRIRVRNRAVCHRIIHPPPGGV